MLFRSTLEKLGFKRSEFDHSLFVFRGQFSGSETVCFLTVHVDDGLATTNSAPFLTHLKGEIAKAFGIKDLGPVTVIILPLIELSWLSFLSFDLLLSYLLTRFHSNF